MPNKHLTVLIIEGDFCELGPCDEQVTVGNDTFTIELCLNGGQCVHDVNGTGVNNT